RVPLMTVFEADATEVQALEPGSLVVIKADGAIKVSKFAPEAEHTPCSFEKIYFSRGNDPSIYRERKAMGAALVDQIVRSIDNAFDNTVFSFIPNTAETAYYGMMDGLRLFRRRQVREEILNRLRTGSLTEEKVDELILQNWPCGEKIAHKDIKLRTFITQERGRDLLVSHVYDITYGVVKATDNLVVIDDSIVRGTTLKKSILKILARTNPRKIVVCSTAPQIRYPDCYGIDMSELGKFIAFQAAVALHRRAGRQFLLDEVCSQCRLELSKAAGEMRNAVKRIYEDFTHEQISAEISRMVYPEDMNWHGDVEIIFQTIENLHASINEPCGDWYFTGNYPTSGGYSTVNHSYIRWHEGIGGRGYELPL
ncbi:MAG: amidophosphoribosyltransferase, partial [Verrucomicrobia bacterium]|nr:amidophosphoribosyltransferase [Verrucomicrobiota bacterium]